MTPLSLTVWGGPILKKGDLDEAVDFLQQAWTQMQDAEIGAHYGEVLWQLANSDKAIEIWQEALQDNPNLPILRKTIKQYAPELLTEHKENT